METLRFSLKRTLRTPTALLLLLGVVCSNFVATHLVIRSSSEAISINDTTIEIGQQEEAYIYCFENDKGHEDRLVLWQRSENQTVGSFMRSRQVFTTGCNARLPHCILVFIDFGGDVAGEYRCLSVLADTPPISSRVFIREAPFAGGRCWVKAGEQTASPDDICCTEFSCAQQPRATT